MPSWTDEACPDEEAVLTCVNPLSDVPAFESAAVAESAGADVSAEGAGAASLDAADESGGAATESSAAAEASSDVVVVVDSSAAELSSAT